MLFSVGHGNYVESNALIAIIQPYSSPAKSLRHSAKENGMLINATCGRKARSMIVLNSKHIVLSALQPDTLSRKLQRLQQYEQA